MKSFPMLSIRRLSGCTDKADICKMIANVTSQGAQGDERAMDRL